MLLKLTNPVLRDNVGKLLFNKLNSDVKLSKLFAELTPHERVRLLRAGARRDGACVAPPLAFHWRRLAICARTPSWGHLAQSVI